MAGLVPAIALSVQLLEADSFNILLLFNHTNCAGRSMSLQTY